MANGELAPEARHSIVYGKLVEPHQSPLVFNGVRYAGGLDHRPKVNSIAGIYSFRDASVIPSIVATKDEGWVLQPLDLENRSLPEPAIKSRHERLAQFVGADVLDLGIIGREQLETMAGSAVVESLLAAEAARESAR